MGSTKMKEFEKKCVAMEKASQDKDVLLKEGDEMIQELTAEIGLLKDESKDIEDLRSELRQAKEDMNDSINKFEEVKVELEKVQKQNHGQKVSELNSLLKGLTRELEETKGHLDDSNEKADLFASDLET